MANFKDVIDAFGIEKERHGLAGGGLGVVLVGKPTLAWLSPTAGKEGRERQGDGGRDRFGRRTGRFFGILARKCIRRGRCRTRWSVEFDGKPVIPNLQLV